MGTRLSSAIHASKGLLLIISKCDIVFKLQAWDEIKNFILEIEAG